MGNDLNFDNLFKGQTIDYTCPNCSHVMKLDFVDTYTNLTPVNCPKCDILITFEPDEHVEQNISNTNNSLKDLQKTLYNFK